METQKVRLLAQEEYMDGDEGLSNENSSPNEPEDLFEISGRTK